MDHGKFTQKATDGEMAKLEAAVNEMAAVEDGIEKLEERIKTGKSRLVELKERTIPELMDRCGQVECLTKSGLRVKIVQKTYGNIPAKTSILKERDPERRAELIERRSAALALIEKVAPDLIKRSFDVQFSREDHKLADKFERDLAKRKRPVPVVRSEKVEPQTLNSWLDKRAEAGALTEEEKAAFAVKMNPVAKVTREQKES